MHRMRLLRTAAALTLTLPLGAGAVPDAKREIPDASSLARNGVRGVDLAIQVASDRAQGLQRKGDLPGSESNGQAPETGFDPSIGDPSIGAPDLNHEGPAPVPEPSSMLLFATSLLLARSAIRRAR
jgi:hypothetical protein